MYKLLLCKGLSYHGIVTATVNSPFVEVENRMIADCLVKTGYFKLISQPTQQSVSQHMEEMGEEQSTEKNKITKKKNLESYTKAELEAYATEIGADITECTNNDQRIAVIKEVLSAIKLANAGYKGEQELEPDFSAEV